MLKDKVVLLTGAGQGIGLAVAKAFLNNDASCVIADVKDQTSEVSDLIDSWGSRCSFLQTDITNADHRRQLIRESIERHGNIDVLFNNAAVFDMAPLQNSDEAMYDRIFDINVKAMFFMMQAVTASMITKKTQGAVINMASQAGRRGEALVSHYCASKAAVISYTQSAALALAPSGIRVNAISPGVIDTPMWDTVDALFAQHESLQPGEKKRQVGEAVPLGRMGEPADIAGAAVFLASDGAGYITGQTLNVDGGNVLS
ncbi:MAG: L-iditol 2-dehydrogenase [Granulosicoccus sp.]|nr:L-iditol 2-dehydrogenase [Granulosicoccus sp.]